MTNNNIHIIIVTYNAMPWIQKCLESTSSYPVIVVDNASKDDSVTYIQENFPSVILLTQKTNLGFGKANNVGIAKALELNAKTVFLLNQDAYLIDDCLDKLFKIQQANPDYGILSPIHINGKQNQLDLSFSKYMNHTENSDFFSDFVLNKNIQSVYSVPFVNAAGWLLSEKCINQVGGFDPLFFHYAEDDNYCHRVLYHGLKVGVVSDAFLIHDREDRKSPKIAPFSKQYFAMAERKYKLRLSNINKSFDGEYSKIIKELKKIRLKKVLKFKWQKALRAQKQLNRLEQLKEQIILHRAKSASVGKTYLDF
ncbi:glycosyltransferase family 2 protein [Flavobacterium sp.]|uniref:glycosyltransferase family 2 protein n=1 Tax=Flavobacterium sp. TaxID=239 RepID=UPI0037BF5279